MKSQIETAVNLFNDGFACSQSILASYCEALGLDRTTAIKLADPFGAGMRGLSATCGAVTGAFMVIGLQHGRIRADDLAAKEKCAELVRTFVARFHARHGAIVCQELLEHDISIPEQHDKAEALGYYRTRCPQFVRSAAEILEEIL